MAETAMETSVAVALAERLDSSISDLEEALLSVEKLSKNNLSSMSPLDRSRHYVLQTYAIESAIFSILRLEGVDALRHPVYQELVRVRQYFEKIKAAETADQARSMTVDRDAAGRIIKHHVKVMNALPPNQEATG